MCFSEQTDYLAPHLACVYGKYILYSQRSSESAASINHHELFFADFSNLQLDTVQELEGQSQDDVFC